MAKQDSIHIVLTGGIGDVVLLTPTIREIKRRRPQVRLFVYAGRLEHYSVLLGNPHIHRLVLLPKAIEIIGAFLYKNRCLPSRYVVPSYYHVGPSLWRSKISASKHIANLFGIELEDVSPQLFLTDEEERFGRSITEGLKIPIAIQAKSACINKEWLTESWLRLVKRNLGYSFINLGLEAEEIAAATVRLPVGLSIRQRFAILKHCRAFVGIDSVMAHAAAAFRIPGVVLFGSSSFEVWGHSTNINLSQRLRCSPCIDLIGTNECPYGRPCMGEISVQNVESALRIQIESPAVERRDLNIFT
jgi:ADP-heptose:LPS heptosyltransferase